MLENLVKDRVIFNINVSNQKKNSSNAVFFVIVYIRSLDKHVRKSTLFELNYHSRALMFLSKI